jgi:thymidylate synthase (FAD)
MEPELLAGALKRIEYAARVSHRSEDETALVVAEREYLMNTGGPLSDASEEIRLAEVAKCEKFIRAVVLQHGDWSVTEHVSASVEFLVDRGITHEIVRHRLAAYTQESTRFVNYAKKMPPTFIYPKPDVVCPLCLAGQEPRESTSCFREANKPAWTHCLKPGHTQNCLYEHDWLKAIESAEQRYQSLVDRGWRPQEARSVFPNALSSKIIVTFNLRQWRHFFLMRTSKEAHPQMRQVTIPLLKEFKRLVPVLYEDIIPESRQIDNICKGQ